MNCKIEILFPEVCNLFGDCGNVQYLKACLPEAEFTETHLNAVPRFVTDNVNLVYMGPMTEKNQCTVISRLMPYRKRIRELIDGGTFFLMTGNAMEIFGRQIHDGKTGIIKCLDILDFSVTRDMLHRFSGLVEGIYNEMNIIGFRAQFTHCEPGKNEQPFLRITKGVSMCGSENIEGVVRNNFYGTYLLGPLLIVNPDFTKYLLSKITGNQVRLAFEQEVVDAYKTRLEEFNSRRIKVY